VRRLDQQVLAFCRQLQPAERFFRYRAGQLCPESPAVVFAEHQLRGRVFLFTILPGEKTNAFLGTECLAGNDTPYFLNLHCGDVAHTLILGMTGSGNAFLKKYAPQRLPPRQMDLPLPA
jgi:hypothetical protein